MQPLRIGIIGCGLIGKKRAEAARRLGHAVAAVCDADAARAAGLAEAHHAEVCADPAALAALPLDLAIVATPHDSLAPLALRMIAAGKHVLVEKPALLTLADYDAVVAARDAAGLSVLVGENDHYKPQLRTLRSYLASGIIGDLVMVNLVTIAERPKSADDWRNDEAMAGGDAFFEEGIHWLHVAGELGPRLVAAHGLRPAPSAALGPDRRARSMVVGLSYDNGATGALLYSREVPSLLKGLRTSKLYGRDGVISFESNGAGVLARGRRRVRVHVPTPAEVADIRGYRGMYADWLTAIRQGEQPQMSLERAREDHVLMEMVARG